jgi:hypothetical protein
MQLASSNRSSLVLRRLGEFPVLLYFQVAEKGLEPSGSSFVAREAAWEGTV